MTFPFEKHVRLLQRYVVPFRGKLAVISFLMLINIAIRIINPQIIRFYLDKVTDVTNLQVILNAATLFIVLALIQEAVYIVNVYFSSDLAWSSTNLLREDLFEHTMSLDMKFHNRYKPGEMIERVDGDVNALSNFLSVFSLMVVSNVLLILGILVAFFIENVLVGVSVTLLVVVAIVAMVRVRLFSVKQWNESRQATAELMGFIEERLGGTEELRANGAEERVYEKFHVLSKKEYDTTNRAVLRSQLTHVVTFFFIGMGMVMIFSLGIPMVPNTISIGTLYLFTYYFQLLLQPIFQILRQIQMLQQADASIDRINDLFATETGLANEGVQRIVDRPIDLEFRGVNFAYGDIRVLRNVSFHLRPGRKVGLIGKTGSGKSTISRLIFRLYDCQEGSILINGVDISDYDLDDIRRQISIVTQEVELFNASVKDNVSFFNRDIADDEVLKVIKLVGLEEWLRSLPEGIETVIKKTGLSAGEAQLLAFARAFLADPACVLLDEASSRLDPITEARIEKAMNLLIEGRTAIIIAHRLETLDRVDDILILEEGEVVEYGSRELLLNDKSSRYSQLLAVGEVPA